MSLITQIVPLALKHAKDAMPYESCGLVYIYHGNVRYAPCRNVSSNPNNQFIIDPLDFARTEDRGEVIGVVHSHIDLPPEPSMADKVSAEESGVQWLIVNPNTDKWGVYTPSGYQAPYVGREFVHGLLDCYTIIRDWYFRELGIDLPDFERQDEWWNKGKNLYMDNFKKAAFTRVYDLPKLNDVVLMQIGANVPNHGAVYLGNRLILHHVQGKLSSRDVYGGYWEKNTVAILRHTSCL